MHLPALDGWHRARKALRAIHHDYGFIVYIYYHSLHDSSTDRLLHVILCTLAASKMMSCTVTAAVDAAFYGVRMYFRVPDLCS